MEFVGRLSAFPVAHVLQWIHNDRRTGVLLVRSGAREKWISFRSGDIVACVSENPEELYSRHLLVNGFADPQTLVTALSWANREGRRLGVALDRLGVLTAAQVRETLRRHIEDSVCGLFLWTDGSFFFEGREVAADELGPEPIDTMALALEGTRWIDEYRRICAAFVHENVLLGRGQAWPGRDLSPLGHRIVTALGQAETLSGLYREIKGSYFRFLEATHHLVRSRVLLIGGWTARGEAHPELGAGEEAMALEEEPLLSQRHLSALLRLLPRLVPAWLGPAPELARQLPEVDGQACLGDLLAGDPLVANRRVDLVLEGLRQGTLALFPPPAPGGGEALLPGADAPADAARRWWRRGRV